MRIFLKKTPALVAQNISLNKQFVIIPNPDKLGQKLSNMMEDGPSNLCIISDFDYTLTQFKL